MINWLIIVIAFDFSLFERRRDPFFRLRLNDSTLVWRATTKTTFSLKVQAMIIFFLETIRHSSQKSTETPLKLNSKCHRNLSNITTFAERYRGDIIRLWCVSQDTKQCADLLRITVYERGIRKWLRQVWNGRGELQRPNKGKTLQTDETLGASEMWLIQGRKR